MPSYFKGSAEGGMGTIILSYEFSIGFSSYKSSKTYNSSSGKPE